MVLCGTWSETSVAPSQLTQFWQIPRHRTLSYSLCTPFFVTTSPSGGTCKYAKAPSTKKKLWEILYLLICSFLPCLSWLLRSRVRKFRRDLWITLYIALHVKYRYSCKILMKPDFLGYIFEKYSNVTSHENPPSSSPVVPFGRKDRHDEANSRNFANAPQDSVRTAQ